LHGSQGRAGFGEIEEVGDQVVDPADFADDVFQVALVGLRQIGAPMQELGPGSDDAQGVSGLRGLAPTALQGLGKRYFVKDKGWKLVVGPQAGGARQAVSR